MGNITKTMWPAPNDVEPWNKPAVAPPPTKKTLADFHKAVEELMGDKEEVAPQKGPSPAASAVFSIERQKNGYIISVTNNGKWVCEDPDRLLDVIKMALADARLV